MHVNINNIKGELEGEIKPILNLRKWKDNLTPFVGRNEGSV